MAPLTIVMYHYVRNLRRSRFPAIKGLSTERFKEQIGYFKRHYTIVSGADLIGAVASGQELPPNALLLTFDDGYLDHYTEVFPILDREGISGCFFPPARCVVEDVVLDVNKIHFVLASVPNTSELVQRVFGLLDEYGPRFRAEDKQDYWERCAMAKRFDSREVVFIKRLLQRELPEELRRLMIDALFRQYVSSDEASFARELYMNEDQILCLHRHGMHLGSHGYAHVWLNRLGRIEQEQEIDTSLEFLRRINGKNDGWMMCYPYGAYDESLLSVLRLRNCTVGLTTRVDLADLSHDDPLTLPRLDTNDLPKTADAPPAQWTLQTCNR
ncbi:polysaccharide deacetylase family protein [Singulisphaera sp. Ch08]|uniref:Polysaccharide deacetylase family protein n=1 Tax=Singulisphaera sp. Ch08 TaxID=3120278 RepID=A0AAU7CQB5_9BACT